MELCTVRLISNILPLPSNPHAPRFLPCTTSTSISSLVINHKVHNHPRFTSGLRYCVNSPLSSTTSAETSTETKLYDTDKSETAGVVTAEDACAGEKKEDSSTSFFADEKKEDSSTSFFADEKKEDSGTKLYEAGNAAETGSSVIVENTCLDVKKEDSVTQINEAPQEDSLGDLELSKFFEDLGVKIDFEENKNSIIALGGGSLIALWLASALVGAIDSIPLFSKLLELVGLGYTIWFTIRYLIFEESRDELFAKVDKIKQEIFG